MKNFGVLFGSMVLLLICIGCETARPQYVAPRVTGRVLDGQTHQPISGVAVQRLSANESYIIENPSKAGTAHDPSAVCQTAADGTFSLTSLKVYNVFEHTTWYAVSLSFHHPAYQSFGSTYSQTTNYPSAEPIVETGDILLMPLAK